ncbi:hypothetical protein ACJRO7_018960 [Eucalyptus globulus]|uniref:Uncharacterized protein n=1 Tax=Eucalyptus globulus TaxID=34317 RepID=A0ABD3KZL5_EUCGL
MYSLHKITFYGQQIYTCVTYDPSIVTRWINDVEQAYLPWLNRLVVGLHIEWQPNLESGVIRPVATLQLCVGHSCLIFQILHAEYILGLDAFVTFKLGMALQASLVKRACVGGCVRPNCVMVPDPVGPILLHQFHS